MDTTTIRSIIQDALTDATEEGLTGTNLADTRSYAEAMVLTADEGFVLRLSDGSEFQITIVQSR